MAETRRSDARAGWWEFVLGMAMVMLSAFALSDSVRVSGGLWRMLGLEPRTTFALAVALMAAGLFGVRLGRSWRRWGWWLWAAGMVVVAAGVLSNAWVYYRVVPMLSVLAAGGLFAGGMMMVVVSSRQTV